MTDQQFCLRWNNHQSTLVSVFDVLLENQTLVDCTLSAEGKHLKAHRVVLCACSPYLEDILSQHYDKHPIVVLKDVKFSELKCMVDYMYRGEVNITQDELGTFLKAAESLQIKGLAGEDGDSRDVGSTSKPAPASQRAPIAPVKTASPSVTDRDGAVSSSGRKRKRIRKDSDNYSDNSSDLPLPQVPKLPVAVTSTPLVKTEMDSLPPDEPLVREMEPASTLTEPMMLPKTEHLEDTYDDDNDVEDLTLDDDEDLEMSQMSNMSQPGTSQADMSNQGFSPWQLGANQSGTDEIFMAAQEAISNQPNNSQDQQKKPLNTVVLNTAFKDIVIQDSNGQILKVINISAPSYEKKAVSAEKNIPQAQESKQIPVASTLPMDDSVAGTSTTQLVYETVVVAEESVKSTIEPGIFECSPVQKEKQSIPLSADPDYTPPLFSADDDSESDNDPKEQCESQGLEPPDADDFIIFDLKQKVFRCKKCMSNYKKKNSLVKHLATCGQFDKEHRCPYCNYSASKAVTLRVHLARNHHLPPILIQSTMKEGERKRKRGRPCKSVDVEDTPTQSTSDIVPMDEFTRKSTRLQKEATLQRSTSASKTSRIKETTRSLTEEGLIVEQAVESDSETTEPIGEAVFDDFVFDKKTGKFKCKNCSKAYKNVNNITKHRSEGCSKEPQHPCLFCPYMGRTPTTLRIHIGHKHGKWPKLKEDGVWIY